MFIFKCPRCSLKSVSVEAARCFHCNNEATTITGVDDNFQEIAISRDSDLASGSRNLLVQNRMQTSSNITVHNRKRNESYNKITDDIQARKQFRKENCGIRYNALSHYWKTDSGYLNSMTEKSAASDNVASDGSNLIDIHRDFLNVEESKSHNQEMKEHGNSSQKRSLPDGQNIASNINILGSQKGNAPINISDSGASVAEIGHSMNDSLDIPGPSNFSGNGNKANLIEKELHCNEPAEIHCVALGSKKIVPCMVCEREIDEHAKINGGEKMYFCCVCSYGTRYEAYLQVHSNIHCPKEICNICSREYTEENAHESEHMCKLCKEIFQCKTLLDQHSVHHVEYLSTHCLVCSREIDDHRTLCKGINCYVCCACRFKSKYRNNLLMHVNIHRPKLFCIICKEDHPIEEKYKHAREFTCIVCRERFKCSTLLEYHSLDHHKDYFSSHCTGCYKTIDEHRIELEGNKFYCCICSYKSPFKHIIQGRLRLHSGLRFFKCDECGKRFFRNGDLLKHSKICMPYKCKICYAKFTCSNSFDKHCLEKHIQV